MKRPNVQAVILVLASLVLALAANALASRQRKVTLVGWYPNATTVPPRTEGAQPTVVPVAPAPVAPTVPATTTTAEVVVTPAPAPAPVTQTVKPIAKPPVTPPANSQPPTANPPDVLARFTQH